MNQWPGINLQSHPSPRMWDGSATIIIESAALSTEAVDGLGALTTEAADGGGAIILE
jgi:hypothetical protein